MMKNKEIQRQRMYYYFIDACKDLIDELGIENLTIRNISDKAGYNSATLYNYFENLDQLIALTLLDSVKPYFYSINVLYRKEISATYLFFVTWREYAKFSFEKPQTFKKVFESDQSNDILKYIDSYFEFFPSEHYDEVRQFVFGKNIQIRDEEMVQLLIKENVLKENSGNYVSDFAYVLHLGMCERIINGYYDKEEQTLELFLKYLIDFFEIYSTEKIDKEKLLTEILTFEI